MPALYVENVPEELYKALRNSARVHRKSMAAEVVSILEEHIPTPSELKARKQFLRDLGELRSRLRHIHSGPSAEQILIEDRSR